ncbi:hypothetical protein [Kribbella jiaozuonensis]|uniref:Secreted protein n=1 Tax=Kribbella jiaozuonensis TaxID=2575441 RepID=A0A4U3LPJ8_9ACTN|nr:hypothetical protein [Kribbella jiaozuonensis]TKK77755.1 hypothetical protein FDA38_21720 [Kribbella jiaozuonensis]
MFRRRLRLSAVAGACLLVAASAATLGAPADAAPADDPTVQVTIDSFGPVAPRPGQPVVIKGRVTNTSSVTFNDPQALACIDRTRLASTAAVDAIPTEQNTPMNDRDSCSNLTNDPQTFKPFDQPLAPKQTVEFTLTVPWKEWRINDQTGVYVVGVTFRGEPPNSARIMAGRARTLMPVAGTTPLTRTVDTALVIPLRHRPTQLGGKNFANDSLAQSLAPTGSLGRLLALGKAHKVTWLLDPAMLDEIRQMTKGYVIVGQNGQTTQGAGVTVATTWLKEFDATRAAGNQVVLLPYGDPDVAGLLDSGEPLKKLVADARKATQGYALPATSVNVPPSFTNGLWLEGGAAAGRYLGAASGGFAGASSSDLNLVSSSSWSAATRPVLTTTPVYDVTTPGPDTSVRTVIANSALTDGGPDPETASSPLQVRQRFAAETALIAASGKGTSSVVVLPPRGWDTDGAATAQLAASLSLPWIKATDVSTVVASNPRPQAVRAPKAGQNNGVLTESHLSSIRDLDAATSTMQALLVDENALPEVMTHALLRSTSSGWNGYPEEARHFTAIELGSANQQLGKVHLVNASVDRGLRKEIKVNLAGSKGTFPLTITNDTEWSVRVGIQVTAANRSDLKITPPQSAILGPRQKWTPRITASAEQNGLIRANAQVVTAGGQSVGKSQELLIQASQYGSVGWVLVGAACALLFGTSFVRIYRRIRTERRNPTPAAEATEASEVAESTDTADPAHDRPAANGVPEAAAPDASLKEGVGSKDG